MLCFFGDGASKQGAFHETLNIASLWKLPVVFVMENNGYNVVTRSAQEDANAAAGEPLSVKAKAYSMPGVTVDGGDPLAVHEAVGEAVERARAGEGPTLVESKVYRLSAHGNIIAPPGVPLHFPEHEAIAVFGNARGVRGRAARRPGAALPRPAGHRRHADRRARPTRSPTTCARRDAGGRRRSASRARSPSSSRRSSTSTPEDRRDTMAHELPYIAAIDEGIQQEMERDPTVLYFGQNMATTENDAVRRRRSGTTACASRRSPRPPRSAWRSAPRWPASARSSSSTWPSSCSSPWTRCQRGAALPLHVRRPGQGAARAQGRLRLHRRLGGPAHRLARRAVHGRAGPEGRRARRPPPMPRA